MGNDNLIVGYCDYYASMRSHFQWIMDNGQLSTIHYQLSIKRRSLFYLIGKGRSLFYSPYSDKNTRKSLKAALVSGELSS
jgi:hypothetical protein